MTNNVRFLFFRSQCTYMTIHLFVHMLAWMQEPYIGQIVMLPAIFRSTLRSRPNNLYMGLRCPSVRMSIPTSVRPQKVFPIPMKFGM